jgi:hypothetical protein
MGIRMKEGASIRLIAVQLIWNKSTSYSKMKPLS